MKTKAVLSIIFLSLIYSVRTDAQEDTIGTLGIGISLDPTRSESIYYQYEQEYYSRQPDILMSAVAFYIPINLNKRFRLEPSFGIYANHTGTTTNSVNPLNGYPEYSSLDASIIVAGIRGMYISRISTGINCYVGPKIELGFSSTTYDDWFINNVIWKVTKRNNTN